ncbi:MAG: PEP/pyruvate-binding domain-containing protein [Deltaproteobacteria bacterium]|nr:PEP/pyruvate-binding domain-containing protein [Deltaproteobacteria bacterium]
MKTKRVFWLKEIGQADNGTFGKKCANLGEMTRLGLPVPDGFAITCTAQEEVLEETGARREIEALLREAGEPGDNQAQTEMSRKIRKIIEEKDLPGAFSEVVAAHYDEMCSRRGEEVAVSVRSAGVVSHPGMYETYLNMRGRQQVLDAIKKVWGSTFNARTIAARVQNGQPVAGSPSIGVGVLEMVHAKSAGVCFTVHPVSGDPGQAVIEANWGLGESCVSGIVSVDMYAVDKQSLKVVERTLGEKKCQIVPHGNGVAEVEVPPHLREAFVLEDGEAAEIVKLGKALEAHFGQPQDLEWAIDAGRPFPQNVYLLQTRPVVGVKVEENRQKQKTVLDDLVQTLFVS